MSNLIFEKIWHDSEEPYCQILCTAEAKKVKVKEEFYVMNSKIIELSEMILSFATNQVCEFTWSNAVDNKNPDFILRGNRCDLAGHLRFELFIKVEDGNSNHSCCFFIDGFEPQMLINFSKGLSSLEMNKIVKMADA